MRIIAGKAGSHPLTVPKSLTRPTADRVREAVFSSLGDLVLDARVLDLFAGSGALGLECLSRGASEATFVDSAREAISAIETNLQRTGLGGARTVRSDVLAHLTGLGPGRYDLAFADPPYARDEATREVLTRLLQQDALVDALSPGGLLVLESFAQSPLPEIPRWTPLREKVYGTTRISYLSPLEGVV